jgi:hypothetical protein
MFMFMFMIRRGIGMAHESHSWDHNNKVWDVGVSVRVTVSVSVSVSASVSVSVCVSVSASVCASVCVSVNCDNINM